jgi:hypothetical protein
VWRIWGKEFIRLSLLIHLNESTAFDLNQEERPIQCPVLSKCSRPGEGGEIRLVQKLFLDRFARGSA